MGLFGFLSGKKACRLLCDPDGAASRKYLDFKDLLERNDRMLDALAALEQTFYGAEPFTPGAVRAAVADMGESAGGMGRALESLSRGRVKGLDEAIGRILPKAARALDQPAWDDSGPFALRLDEYSTPGKSLSAPGPASPPTASASPAPSPSRPERERWPLLAGGKALSLARIKAGTGLLVPEGFAVTTAAFAAFLKQGGLADLAARELEPVSPLDLPGLEAACARIRQALLAAPLPGPVREELASALQSLTRLKPGRLLAVRSSAVGEDGAVSFAGQYESVLNVPPDGVEEAVKRVFAGKYTPRAVLYRLRHGLDDSDAPMAALVLPMVRSRVSGVLYTIDPAAPDGASMRLDAVEGLGDTLVSGEAAPFSLAVSREAAMIHAPSGFPLTGGEIAAVARAGFLLEELFGAPQDVEWCFEDGRLHVVQSRPLEVAASGPALGEIDLTGRRVLAGGGVTASPGAAFGQALHVAGAIPEEVPEGAIIVAVNASPELAALMDRAGGVVAELGGAASHLASVAREMGIPALFGAAGCVAKLQPGTPVTLDATGARVFEGCVEELLTRRGRPVSRLVGSPMHARLRAALDRVSPLTLTDPEAESFTPAGCETLHDITRFAHETGMREMFGLAGDDSAPAVRLKAAIPLTLYCMDLGGGLKANLTDCDAAMPEDIQSAPMRAIWRGFTHPGITWSGTVAFDARSLMTLIASSATAEVGGGQPGGDSYALLGADYVNLSARFGYHFANIDAVLCDQASKNHVTLRFGGGAGGFAGKSLRVAFLAGVLSRLGFAVKSSGDVLDATFKGAPREAAAEALDQLGRLMASSRLLDMAITSPAEAERMAQAFLDGDYDLLSRHEKSPLPGFHLTDGDWERVPPLEDGAAQGGEDGAEPSRDSPAEPGGALPMETGPKDPGPLAAATSDAAPPEAEAPVARQDGTRWATGLSMGLAGLMGKVAGQRYQRFLDSIEAYFHFPLAVAKNSRMGDGRASVMVRPVDGRIDQAGGLAFAVRTAGTYLALRINALEDNLILFEFVNGRRSELASAAVPVRTGQWRELAVEVSGNTVMGFLDGKPYIIHHFEEPPAGLLGLWTKADSVTEFASLASVFPDGTKREFPI
jgi:pyruvate,water dikinase